MRPRDIVRKIRELEGASIISVEEAFPYYILMNMRVSGTGIIVRPLPPKVYNRFYHGNFDKRGSIIRFTDVAVPRLEEFRHDVLFLVTEVKLGGMRIDIGFLNKVFVVEYELVRRPEKLKLRFKAWRFYTGEIKYGKRVWRVKWMVRVPTRISRHIMFLGSREDEYNLINIVFKYTHMKYGSRGNRVLYRGEYPAAILFS